MKWALAFLLITLPNMVFGQTGGLVTCNGRDCTACDFVTMVNDIVQWLFSIVALIAVIGLVIVGFQLVMSGGNVSARSKAESMFKNIIIGFIIMLSAWLIVDTLVKMLMDPDLADSQGVEFGMWNDLGDLQCGGTNTNFQSGALYDTSPQTQTEEEARDDVRENFPNVIDTYTGNSGTPEHITFIRECVAQGGKGVLREGTTNVVDCRTQ